MKSDLCFSGLPAASQQPLSDLPAAFQRPPRGLPVDSQQTPVGRDFGELMGSFLKAYAVVLIYRLRIL